MPCDVLEVFCLSVRSLHVLHVSVGFLRDVSFFPRSENIHFRLVGDCELLLGWSVCPLMDR